MSKKLQNIKAVNQMLTGEHKFQNKTIIGFNDTLHVKNRFVGETWKEIDPKTGIIYLFEQKDGYVMKTKNGSDQLQTVRDELDTFSNCPKETCTCITPNHLDRKMRALHNMCYDCVVEMEHELRLHGKFNKYAINRMKQNALAWLERAEKDIELLKQSYTMSYQVLTNSDGQLETLDAKMTPQEFEETVEREFKQYKEKFLSQLSQMEDIDDH
jgi:hypothetical protein